MNFVTSRSLSILTFLTLGIAPVSAQSARTDAFLATQLHQSAGSSRVIVRSDHKISPREEARLKALGGDIYRHLPLVSSVALQIPSQKLKALAALPFVKHLSADVTVRKTDEFTVEHSGADIAWGYGFKGTGIGVAVLDSGVAQFHPDLRRDSGMAITNGPDFIGDKSNGDPCGHGSHVAGIIAGDGSASLGSKAYRTFYGVAPDSRIVNVRILDKDGVGTVSNAIAAIQWVIDNKTSNGNNIRVLNLSIGHEVGESYKTDPLCQAVEAAWRAGIVVVCAAGNNGRLYPTASLFRDNEGYGTNYGSVQSPANDPLVITVGAVKNNFGARLLDQIATYSSRGPSRLDYIMKPDLVAPGNRVISLNSALGYNQLSQTYSATNALPWSAYLTTELTDASLRYFYLSGTSMAAPVVAGAAALLLQEESSLSPDSVKARLMLSADKLWSDPNTYGAGLLNIPAALSLSAKANRDASSPMLALSSSQVFVDPSKAIWGVTSGTKAIWGVTGITDYKAIWGVKAIWGSTSPYLSTSLSLLGQSVWTNKAVWGTSGASVDLSSTAIFGE